jgi:hypothetical protein
MTHDDESAMAEELAKLEAECHKAVLAIADARNVREVVALDDVDVPHHLRGVAHSKVPALGRLRRLRDNRVEELVKHQLDMLRAQPNELLASREFDRIKAGDWFALRANYPDLYGKSVREATLILERKRKR